jgi:hypothetical protein
MATMAATPLSPSLGFERRSATKDTNLCKSKALEGVASRSADPCAPADEPRERLDTPERATATLGHLPGGAALMRSGSETS